MAGTITGQDQFDFCIMDSVFVFREPLAALVYGGNNVPPRSPVPSPRRTHEGGEVM